MPTYTAKEYNQVVLAKRELRVLWLEACAIDGITDTSATCIIFSNGNPKSDEYNTRMGAYFKMVKHIKANAARRARHTAMTDLGLVRVKGNLGTTFYE